MSFVDELHKQSSLARKNSQGLDKTSLFIQFLKEACMHSAEQGKTSAAGYLTGTNESCDYAVFESKEWVDSQNKKDSWGFYPTYLGYHHSFLQYSENDIPMLKKEIERLGLKVHDIQVVKRKTGAANLLHQKYVSLLYLNISW